MKKTIFSLVLCLIIVPVFAVMAYEDDYLPENPYYYYDHYYYYQPEEYHPHEDLGHFATATIEELQAHYENSYYYESEAEEVPCFDPPLPPAPVPPPRYNSSSVVVMDADTGLVLYGSNHHTQMYPASITKIMTALIVIEEIQDLNERIEFSHNAIWSIPRYSSHIAMDEGETLTVYQALFGLMLSSANEVSIALAEHVSGSVEAFAEKMNTRAASLGAHNTFFVNPSGLPDEGHVTTAYDMALIMREAVRHPLFVDIMSTRRFDIPPTERQDSYRSLLNTNRMIHPGSYFNEWVIGSKTGFTNAARHTLVTYAEHKGRRLIISTLEAEAGDNFRDTLALMSFGFSMPFEERRVFEASSYIRMVPVYQNINDSPLNVGYVTLRAPEDLYFMLPADFDIRDLRYDLTIPERVTPPVEVGDELGHVVVYIQNILAGEVILTAQNAVLALPGSDEGNDPWVGGGDQLGSITPGYQPGGYYPGLTVYPTSLWSNENFRSLTLPIAIGIVMLAISLIAVLTSRKRNKRKVHINRFVKYYGNYKYK